MSTPFRMLRAFNDPSLHVIAGSKTHIGKNTIALFQGSTLTDSLVRELAHERALGIKEVTEAFEFYAAIRKHVRNECIVDLCCGHGLAGLLFAVFDRKTWNAPALAGRFLFVRNDRDAACFELPVED